MRGVHGIPDEAVVFGVFGGLTPDKRISQILAALETVIPYAPPRVCCSPALPRVITMSPPMSVNGAWTTASR